MNLVEDALNFLRRVIDEQYDGSLRKAAYNLGVPSQTLYAWLKYQTRTPNLKALEPILERLNVKFIFPDKQYYDYAFIPKHAAKAGAGASLETSDEVEGYYAFRNDWLLQHGIHAKNAVILEVSGDSMEPVFNSGDAILIDKADTDVKDGNIYVVTLGDELRVKRVYKSLSGIILRSENDRYPDVPVTGTDLEQLRIHGRVRWCGKVF